MTPEQRKQMRQFMQQEHHDSQFRVNSVAYHTHNGVDSPKIITANSSSTTYAGLVNADGTAGSPFPVGWSISKTISGRYDISHTLGTANYSVTVTVSGQNKITIPNISSRTGSVFEVYMYNQTGATSWSATDTAFYFIVSL